MNPSLTKSALVSCTKPTLPPVWSSRIDRWSQLDDSCFTFCEALHAWDYLVGLEKPQFIFIVLPNASNEADLEFVNSGAASPSKFVFTLPNICASVLFQLIPFSGRTFCISKGLDSLPFALGEAKEMAGANKSCWVFANSSATEIDTRQVEFYLFSNKI